MTFSTVGITVCITLWRRDVVDELERAVDTWLREHAPDHRGHHVQVGGGAVICRSCGMVDLTTLPVQRDTESLIAV